MMQPVLLICYPQTTLLQTLNLNFVAIELGFLILWAELFQVNVSKNLASDEV